MARTSIAAILTALALPVFGNAAELTVTYADPITPDAGLRAMMRELRSLATDGKKENIGKVEAFFAPRVKVFQRSLDPFQPWKRTDDLKGGYLGGVADAMVEQGEFEAGMPVPDYRLEAMKQIASLIPEDAAFGALPQVSGAVCAPAAYEIDRKAALAFARRFELDGCLRFFEKAIMLQPRPGSATAGIPVPARSLMIFDYHPEAPEGWSYYETAGGIKGFTRDEGEPSGLAQNHVCFSQVKGKYRISAVFGYGL